MQVEPAKLVDLAASSESILESMSTGWADAQEALTAACEGLGDAAGTMNVKAAYADSLTDAGEVVLALVQALEIGVTGLVDAARDALDADETVAADITRASHSFTHTGPGRSSGHGGFGLPPGHGGGR